MVKKGKGVRSEAVHTAIQPQEKKKATFNLDAELHRRLKVAAAIHRREMVEMVEEALEDYLSQLKTFGGCSRLLGHG